MAASTAAISLLLLVFATLAAAETAQPMAATGGRTTIEDAPTNKMVQSLGRFAVAEHNRSLSHGGGSGGNGDPITVRLAFTGVAAAQRQVVSGVAYYLKVIARERGAGAGGDRPIDAVVVVKAWLKHKSKELVSFMPSPK
uniref:Uncharacterized protein n=1 Tax=Avena sativa TaxID=4498 RepID=A0ACD5UWT9_AVESA